jgi:hypothetical protein
MMPCPSHRLAPSLALLLGCAAALAGCSDPKTSETADDGSGSAESGSAGSAGSATEGQSSSQTDGSDTGPQPCPPIDIGPCQECTCIDGGWVCEPTCGPSCDGLECGAACLRCPDDDPECLGPSLEGVCTVLGACVGVPPPKLGFCLGALQPGFEVELTASGCADVLIEAQDDADERGLVVQLAPELGLAQAAIATGEPQHLELSATDPNVTIEGRAGFNVTAAECNDVIEPGIDIKETWAPVSGAVIVDVVPDGAGLARATVQLVGVELYRVQPGPGPLVVDVTWSDVLVGWFPG